MDQTSAKVTRTKEKTDFNHRKEIKHKKQVSKLNERGRERQTGKMNRSEVWVEFTRNRQTHMRIRLDNLTNQWGNELINEQTHKGGSAREKPAQNSGDLERGRHVRR